MDVLRFKQANCKNCYKCVRFCPVKSIRVYQGHAQIISSDCILCGNCVSVCPQHAKEDISDVAQIQELIASGQQVVVSVDSSYIAYFDTPGFAGIAEPLKSSASRQRTRRRRAPIWSRRSWKSSPPSRVMRQSSPPAVRRSCSMWKSICRRHCRIWPRCSRRCRHMPCCCASVIRARPLSISAHASPRRRRRRALRASAPTTTSRSRSSRTGCMRPALPSIPTSRLMSRCSRAATRSQTAFCAPCRSIPGATICSLTVWMTAFRRSRASSMASCATALSKCPPATATASAVSLSGRSTQTCSNRAAA